MIRLVYYSIYTEYTAGIYPNMDECVRDCQVRYGLKTAVFGQDDAGTLYTALYAEEGVIVLKLYEVESAGA